MNECVRLNSQIPWMEMHQSQLCIFMPKVLPTLGVRFAGHCFLFGVAHASLRAACRDAFLTPFPPCFDSFAASFALCFDSFAARFVPPNSGSTLERASANISSRRSPSTAAQRPTRFLVFIPISRSFTPAPSGVSERLLMAQPPATPTPRAKTHFIFDITFNTIFISFLSRAPAPVATAMPTAARSPEHSWSYSNLSNLLSNATNRNAHYAWRMCNYAHPEQEALSRMCVYQPHLAR